MTPGISAPRYPSNSRSRTRRHFDTRRELTQVLLIVSLIALGHQVWIQGTWTAPIKHTAFWAEATAIYGQSLTDHDKAVVEQCAKNVGVTPERVILTLLYGQNPSVSEGVLLSKETESRLNRIAAVNEYFIGHPLVAHRLSRVNKQEAIRLLETNTLSPGATR